MIPDQKLFGIASKLLEKSRAGKVRWTRVGHENNSYTVTFPHSRINVEFVSPRAEPDYVRLSVVNYDNDEVGAYAADETESNWPLLQELYWEAERHVTGWDKVLIEIEGQLDEQGVIGQPQTQDLF